jgi:hypothetical protein
MALVALVAYPLIRPYDSYPQVVLLLAFLLATQVIAINWEGLTNGSGSRSPGRSGRLNPVQESHIQGLTGPECGFPELPTSVSAAARPQHGGHTPELPE